MNTSSCICPVDRYGPDCSAYRPMICTGDAAYPEESKCDDVPDPLDESDDKWYLLDKDPACPIFNISEKAELGYYLDCRFRYPPEPVNSSLANFTYWLSNDKVCFYLFYWY